MLDYRGWWYLELATSSPGSQGLVVPGAGGTWGRRGAILDYKGWWYPGLATGNPGAQGLVVPGAGGTHGRRRAILGYGTI